MVGLDQALDAARTGEMPPFTPESLVLSLELEGKEPDGMDLMGRFIGEADEMSALRGYLFIRPKLIELSELTNEGAANPAQEAIAQALGAVVSRQIDREGKSNCPLANHLAKISTREDLIPAKIRAMLE